MREGEGAPQPGSGFFQNRACPHFPCHRGVAPARFNCLFCYCPLYALGPRCGGDFRYTASGTKDCTDCVRLHDGDEGVSLVQRSFGLLADLARDRRGPQVTSPERGNGSSGTGEVAGGPGTQPAEAPA